MAPARCQRLSCGRPVLVRAQGADRVSRRQKLAYQVAAGSRRDRRQSARAAAVWRRRAVREFLEPGNHFEGRVLVILEQVQVTLSWKDKQL